MNENVTTAATEGWRPLTAAAIRVHLDSLAVVIAVLEERSTDAINIDISPEGVRVQLRIADFLALFGPGEFETRTYNQDHPQRTRHYSAKMGELTITACRAVVS